MKTKVYLVKIKSIAIRGGAFYIEDYNGNSDYFPKSTVIDISDNEVYIAEWILEKKSITYSRKKAYWYNQQNGKITEHIEVIKVVPKKIEFDPSLNIHESLIK